MPQTLSLFIFISAFYASFGLAPVFSADHPVDSGGKTPRKRLSVEPLAGLSAPKVSCLETCNAEEKLKKKLSSLQKIIQDQCYSLSNTQGTTVFTHQEDINEQRLKLSELLAESESFPLKIKVLKSDSIQNQHLTLHVSTEEADGCPFITSEKIENFLEKYSADCVENITTDADDDHASMTTLNPGGVFFSSRVIEQSLFPENLVGFQNFCSYQSVLLRIYRQCEDEDSILLIPKSGQNTWNLERIQKLRVNVEGYCAAHPETDDSATDSYASADESAFSADEESDEA